ncbi:conserved Plasmodium protein, unknown function [Plasmodium relictum]|uniref:Autophagy-related protein 16 domain-containing protein n=1 Tax=Plasmodium relictum TaxID=85471 RepID=A0A1J1HC97_PLARL|nr:conserved Plasmodium protein, unknown function [Plasmodium relictum]CRH02927.1 conserved Plasmodium protein, unknown function [Plasmodium relictum]
MKEWKSTILSRLKQRNISQSEKYQDILLSYNSLVEEKNKLLAIIASLSSDNIYLLNNKNFSLAHESSVLNENDSKNNFLNNKSKDSIDSLINSENNIIRCKNVDNYLNFVSKKEFLEIIIEKGKNEELILLLKSSLSEKEKLLNILNKENELLINTISKREEEFLKKKREVFKLNEIVNKNNLEIKFYSTSCKSMKHKMHLLQKKNTKLLREYENLKFTYLKLLRQNHEIKNYKKTIDKEYFDLRNEMFKKKLENENLLKYLLKCKRNHKNQLKKLEKMCSHMANNVWRSKYIFFKKKKLRVCLYLSKLNNLHNIKRYLTKATLNYDDFVLYKNNYYKNKIKHDIIGQNMTKKLNSRKIKKTNQSFQIINNYYNNSSNLEDKVYIKHYNSDSSYFKSKNYSISLNEENIYKNNETFQKIKSFLNVHPSGILCFSISSRYSSNYNAMKEYINTKKKKKLRRQSLNIYNKIKNLRSLNNTSNCIKNEDINFFISNKNFFKNHNQPESDNMIVTCGRDGKIAFINIEDNQLKCTKIFYILDSKIPANNISIHPSQIHTLLAMEDNTMCLINNKKNKVEYMYYDHKEKITSINFLCNYNHSDKSVFSKEAKNSLFYSTSLDKTIKIWDMEKNICVSIINVDDSITSSSVSTCGSHLLIGTQNGSVICYDLRINNKNVINSILYNKHMFSEQIYGLNYSPDDKLIAIQAINGNMKLLNTNKIDLLHIFETPYYIENPIPKSPPIFSRDGKKLMCSYAYNMISYDILNYSYFNILNNELDEITGTNWNLNDKLLTIHKDGNIAIW